MALPKQVQDQLDEAERIEQQISSGQQPPEVVEPTIEEPKDPVEEQPVETPIVAEEPVEDDDKKLDQELEVWKQKYRTLQGMYDAEVPRLHTQVKELHRSVAELTAKLEEVPAPAAAQVAPADLVTDEDVQNYGEDLINVQRKIAREAAAETRGELEKLRADNEALREQLNTTDGKVSEASFETKLNRLVPDFDQINASPEWIAWLNEVDPILRAPRMSVAQDAYARGDADAVAYYVSMFKDLKPAEPEVTAADRELAQQIQPNRTAATTAAKTAPQGRVYSNKDISEMFKRIIELGNRGQHAEATKLEAEIDAAYLDGRVTN
jgi:hypothetical protein